MFDRSSRAFAGLLRCVCVLIAVVIGVGVAGLSRAAQPSSGGVKVREPSSEERAQRRAADQEAELQRAEDEKERKRQREDRKAPEQREARRRSRSVFKGLSADEALAADRRHHRRTLERPVGLKLRHRKGE